MLVQELLRAYDQKNDVAFEEQLRRVDSMEKDVSQAHHVLDILGVQRIVAGSDGGGPERLNLLGRLRCLQTLEEAKTPVQGSTTAGR